MSFKFLEQHAYNMQDPAHRHGDLLSLWYAAGDSPRQPRDSPQPDGSAEIASDEEQSRRRHHISKNKEPPLDIWPTSLKQVKTRSEMRCIAQLPDDPKQYVYTKHNLRHAKPFRCSNASCSGKEGYSTVNDLNRHVRIKHSDAPPESSKRYQCHAVGCKSKDKIWARLDNFRSHLKRIHRLTEEEIVETVATISPSILQALQKETQCPDNSPESQCLEANMISGQPQSPTQLFGTTDPIKTGQSRLTSDKMGSESSKKVDNENMSRMLQILKDAGYHLTRNESPERGRGSERTDNVRKIEKVGCTHCKFEGRPCELKKHMKRHTRPYGCTFRKCHKTFGSKNDWKRHETSQHYQLETWRCDGNVNGHTCTKIFLAAGTFRSHLEKVHHLPDQEIDSKIVAPRSRALNSQAHFWCGFCESIVELHQENVDAWTERFNHIDDHFMGRYGTAKQSSEWLHPDPDDKSKIKTSSGEPDHSQSRRMLIDFPPRSSSVTSFSMSDCTTQTVSEVGINWDGAKSSDTRVYYNMYNMINGQQEVDVAKSQQAHSSLGGDSIQEVVVGKLMRELPSIFNREWTTKIETHGENHPTAPTDSVRGKRSIEHSDKLDQENASIRAPKRLKSDFVQAADDYVGLRLACPFRKHNPRKYTIHSHRSCALSFWDSVARVKEHIYRRHRQPTQCKRCWKLFKNQDELDIHHRADNICKIEPGEPADGLSATDVARIRSRKKASPDQSEEERWQEIYGIIFPGEPVPAPSFDQVHDDIASSPVSRDSAYYEEYSRRELPNFFRRWLEVAASKEIRIDHLRRELIAMVRKCQDRAFSAWQTKNAPLKITRGTVDKDTSLELPQGQVTISQSLDGRPYHTPEVPTVIRHPAPFELNGPDKGGTHTPFGSAFPSRQVIESNPEGEKGMETRLTSSYCLGPCVCSKTSNKKLTTEPDDPFTEVLEDLPNEEWVTSEFENFDLPTPSEFLNSDVDWEAMFIEMS